MDSQQEIFLAIFKAFEKEKIEFAYPTQTIQIDGMQSMPAPAGEN